MADCLVVYIKEDGTCVLDRKLDNKTHLGELPKDIQTKLSAMMLAPDGYYDEKVGRRLSSKTFWVYLEK